MRLRPALRNPAGTTQAPNTGRKFILLVIHVYNKGIQDTTDSPVEGGWVTKLTIMEASQMTKHEVDCPNAHA